VLIWMNCDGIGTGWGSIALLKKLETENYNVIVISPRNYFLFTPLLPSCSAGSVEHRSIMEPVRYIVRHKKGVVKFYEAEVTKIDTERRVIICNDFSDVKGAVSQTEIPFNYLVVGVGAENATFGMLIFCVYLNELTFCRYSRCQGTCMFPQRNQGCSKDSNKGHGLH
jgi:NADH dehydrogenase FAD-containing subunit